MERRKPRTKRVMLGNYVSAARLGSEINHGTAAPGAGLQMRAHMDVARSLLRLVNVGRRQQGLPRLSLDELVFLIRQHQGSIDRKVKFKK